MPSPNFLITTQTPSGPRLIAAKDPKKIISIANTQSSSNFLEELRSHLRKTAREHTSTSPFTSGWMGYLSYEMYEDVKISKRPVSLLPRAVFAYFDSVEILESQEPASCAPFSSTVNNPASYSNISRENYRAAVNQVKDLITAGDCYQVNLSQKFTFPISESAENIYRRLQSVSPAPYAAFVDLGDAQILSSSPELFLSLDGDHVVTRPIKGTRPRGRTPEEDQKLKDELLGSAKDKAELLMITDLERNDLGRVCTPGSVHVSDLGSIETYAQVHHRVSTVEGRLAPGKDIMDLIRATFPSGSITGAPKIRAMQIIREMEPHAREIYCGAIGFISDSGQAQFNVAIRTMVIKDGQAHLWSGGGIVADSDPEKEYEETLIKARGMLQALYPT